MGERWTREEEGILIVEFEDSTIEDLAERVGRSEDAVRCKLRELGIHRTHKWEQWEDDDLTDMWPHYTAAEIAEVLSRRLGAICRRATKLGLPRKRRRWTKAEDNYVLMSIGDVSYDEMAEHLGRTNPAVASRARLLNVKSDQGKRKLAEAAEILGIGIGTLVRRLKKSRANYVVIDGHGDVTDDMIVKVAKHLIKKPNATGPCNVSVRRLQQVVAEYGGDVKKKRARKTSKGEDDGHPSS